MRRSEYGLIEFFRVIPLRYLLSLNYPVVDAWLPVYKPGIELPRELNFSELPRGPAIPQIKIRIEARPRAPRDERSSVARCGSA